MSGPLNELIFDLRELHVSGVVPGDKHMLVCTQCETRWPCMTIALVNKYDPEMSWYVRERDDLV